MFTAVCMYNVFSISLLTKCHRVTCSVSCLSTTNRKLNTKTYFQLVQERCVPSLQ